MLKDSYASVNIKAVAERLGCSNRPISWQFGSMDGLRQALIPAAQKYAAEKYPVPNGNTIQTLEQSGWGIIDMALDEPNLFRFLYMGESGRRVNSGLSMAPDGGTGQEAMRQLATDLSQRAGGIRRSITRVSEALAGRRTIPMKCHTKTQWVSCPDCGGNTRTKVREDTILQNFLLFCPKCKQERLINLKQFHMTLLSEPDAKTQSQ